MDTDSKAHVMQGKLEDSGGGLLLAVDGLDLI